MHYVHSSSLPHNIDRLGPGAFNKLTTNTPLTHSPHKMITSVPISKVQSAPQAHSSTNRATGAQQTRHTSARNRARHRHAQQAWGALQHKFTTGARQTQRPPRHDTKQATGAQQTGATHQHDTKCTTGARLTQCTLQHNAKHATSAQQTRPAIQQT